MTDSSDVELIRGPGEFISFTDSEAEAQERERPKKKARTAAALFKAKAAPRRARGSGKTIVGRRQLATKSRSLDDTLDTSDEENDLLEHTLPQFLQDRRKRWRNEQQEHGEKVLLIPPTYQHAGDLGPAIEEKPVLPSVTPPRPHEDYELRRSAGLIPAPIAKFLKPYQLDGTQFLHHAFVYQKGVLLGDDMGLGKTIQVIAFLTAAFGHTADKRDEKRMRAMRRNRPDAWYPRALIICPGGLMANWKNELDRWGYWKIYSYHGSPTARDAAIAAAENGRLEIMITTYDTYKNHQDDVNCIQWDCVIADEVHIIKERKSQVTKAMNDVNALCRIGLSGTAIQNKYEELWTLLNWANPGCVSSVKNWKDSICIPLKQGQSHDATVSQLAKSRRVAEKLVKNLLPRFFIRRTKGLIAHQLPKKTDRVVFCPLTATQSEAYNNFTDSELVHAIRDCQNLCYCGSGRKQGWCCRKEVDGIGPWLNQVFPVLQTLQKISNHIALLLPSGEADPEKHEKDLEKLKITMPEQWQELYSTRDLINHKSNVEFCGKWKVLKKLLKLWSDNGDKVLIFSHSVLLLGMLHRLLQNLTSYNVSYLDGKLRYDERQAEVDDFNSNPSQFVFLISTRAGGVGLNITSANKVVVVDPNWNPAWDLQAQDRAYRIGQTRDVEVFRLVSAGTMEEIVYARQIYKQQQANIGYNASVERRYFKGVQDQRDQKGEIFGLANLFAPQKANVVLRDIVNKTNIAETRAGFDIVGLDLEASHEDDEGLTPFGGSPDDALSALASEIVDEPSRMRKLANETAQKKDPVHAILASAGVEYTHENAEVIGTSKIETKISSRAQKTGNDVDYIKEYAFAKASQSQLEQLQTTHIGAGDDIEKAKIHYRYRPAEDVRRRQFCSMAKHYGYDDVTEFALVVEGWTQEQRRDCLDKFYKDRAALFAPAKVGEVVEV